MSKYGTNIKDKFLLNPNYCFLNHGSFGAAGIDPHNLRIKLINEMEDQADVWFRKKILTMWNENLHSVSEFFHSKPENLVLVSNTTTGINCVMRSLKFNRGDGILINSWTYNAIKNVVTLLKNELCSVEVHIVEIPEQMDSSHNLVSLYEEELRKHPNIKIAIIDYISSMPACLMPVNELISICKKYDKLVLIDGAHAPGQVPLNLESLECDFFAGNLHKWCYAPRGCAILWVDPKFHKQIFPSVVSRYNNSGDLSDMFYYQGTSDNTQFYVAKSALEFYENIGGYANINEYCTSLIDEAADMLAKQWNTEKFHIPRNMEAPFMRVVRLPDLKNFPIPDNQTNFADDLTKLMWHLWNEFEIQTVCISMYNKGWIRLSVNVYNTIYEYKKLGDVIKSLAI